MSARVLGPIDVLLVDDDEEDYILTKDLLSSLDGPRHEIHWVNDYGAALGAVEGGHYDVCLVDYQLGAENGLELIRELVSNGHEMPVIVLTGRSDRDIDVEAARAGAADYLVKGEVSPELLERTIRYAMQSHADLQELREKEDRLEKVMGATILELGEEKRRVESFYGFCRTLASGMDAEALGGMILRELSEFAGAEIGVLYTIEGEAGGENLRPLAARGLGKAQLPETLPAELDEKGSLKALDPSLPISYEAFVPLFRGERKLGALLLARTAGPFSETTLRAINHLADQASVAIADAMSFRRMSWLTNITRAVLDATVDAIHMVDLDGTTLVANSALERLATEVCGSSSADVLHSRLPELSTDPQRHRASAEAIAADPECEGWNEYEFAGSGRVLRRYTAPVWDSGGSLIGRIFVFREVTAEREAERLKSELVATVSHELRTPLASVLGFSEILATREHDPETQKRYIGLIHQEARRLSDLTNDFLDLQRIEKGSFQLAREPFDLAAVLREQTEVFAGQSERHKVEVDLPGEPLEVLGERDRIAQVVSNLLANAIKYSPKGGLVRLAAKRANGEVRIAVTDSGIGIPEDQQEQLFTKFFRVDSSDTREIGGTGLGLALCRELVEAHGGRIGMESVQGKGSTFWFELPATPSAAQSGR